MRNYKKKSICIIPARGKSKRIPNKNIKSFFGKPIISYVIKAALRSKLFDSVIISTDNKKIAQISKKFGAKIHNRNSKYADDYTNTIDVIKHVIEDLDKKKFFIKVCCIYPTSVFFTKKNLLEAFKKLSKNKNYVFSATKYDHPIYRSFYKRRKKIHMVFPNMFKKRTQDLFDTFHDAAQFYFGWRNSWIKRKKIFSDKSEFVELSKFKSQDIDDLNDWKNAEILWKVKKNFK